ncbi:multiple sugar transport system permease protein [Propionibacterium cyclohexanicum]|uniref:Multiple sugar transport system permease protein n=1 Tax=Propionibacterium cyclohexanicum TaxID=64702 RepID=A0A1H9TU92_9ACTN|nr:carbohydrate ABC transporter permease [Propionibacterium cyclohexanicum]SES00669.1 multiple sugar transport system permease protein [Propionibacterium cyclohexanicum]
MSTVTGSKSHRRAAGLLKPRKYNPNVVQKNWVRTIIIGIFVVYALFPLVWLLINATKTQQDFIGTFGFSFGHKFAFWDNIVQLFTYNNGLFGRWLLNTVMYVVIGGGGAVCLAILGGYGLAKYDFPGRKAVFMTVMGAIAVPSAALAVPTFLMFAKLGLTNTPISVIIPSLVAPFGLYLMYIFTLESVPTEILEAARMDGASEFRTFFTVALPLLAPGIVTVSLFTATTTWNNYFLPLIMLKDQNWYPLIIGLNQWNNQAFIPGAEPVQNLVVIGSLITILPLVATFLLLQRFWQAGLSAGGVKE